MRVLSEAPKQQHLKRAEPGPQRASTGAPTCLSSSAPRCPPNRTLPPSPQDEAGREYQRRGPGCLRLGPDETGGRVCLESLKEPGRGGRGRGATCSLNAPAPSSPGKGSGPSQPASGWVRPGFAQVFLRHRRMSHPSSHTPFPNGRAAENTEGHGSEGSPASPARDHCHLHPEALLPTGDPRGGGPGASQGEGGDHRR